jgi:aspartate racemase
LNQGLLLFKELFVHRVGVLGGMGPAATVDFMAKLVSLVPAKRDQEHVPVVVYSVPQIPDRSENLLSGGPSPLPGLLEGLKALEQSGAELICIACNTAHAWYPQLQAQARSEVLHIVDATVQEIRQALGAPTSGLKIGLLATDGTLASNLYPQRAPQDLSWVIPDQTEQAEVMAGIRAVKAGNLEFGRAKLLAVANALQARGAQAVVGGCTEIPLVLRKGDLDVPVIDTTLALAKLAVKAAQR